jgi:hypothetical protein
LWHTSCSLIKFFLTRWTYKKNKNSGNHFSLSKFVVHNTIGFTHTKLWNNPNLEINFFNFWYNVTLPVMKSQASVPLKEFTLLTLHL